LKVVLEETYPAIEARPEREGAETHWGDEVGVAADQLPARGYAPQGQPATMAVPGRHVRANQISTITNGGEVRFMTYTRTMTAALSLVFLGRPPRSTTGKVFLIVDRLRAHMTPAVQEWVSRHRDRIEVFYLPRYAPELNPDEYLNNDLKGQVNDAGLPHGQGGVIGPIQGISAARGPAEGENPCKCPIHDYRSPQSMFYRRLRHAAAEHHGGRAVGWTGGPRRGLERHRRSRHAAAQG